MGVASSTILTTRTEGLSILSDIVCVCVWWGGCEGGWRREAVLTADGWAYEEMKKRKN